MKLKKRCNGKNKNGEQCNRILCCGKNEREVVYCKTHRPTFYEKEDCAVCTDGVQHPLECGHWIHKQCVIQSGKPICPICRKDVQLSKEQYEKTMEYDSKYKQQFIEEDEEELLQMYSNDIPVILQIISEVLTGEMLIELEEGQNLRYNIMLNTDGMSNQITNEYMRYLNNE